MKSLFDYVDLSSHPSRTVKERKEKDTSPQPFIQWVGGKRQLIDRYDNLFPVEYENYYEPFVGGGAVFYWQHSKFGDNKKYYLSDLNEELVITYNAVKTNPEQISDNLDLLNEKHSKQFYYHVRNIDRAKVSNNRYQKQFDICRELDPISVATRFIYLNRTCFNGMYRVSSDGTFNIPIGKTLSKNVSWRERLMSASKALQNVTITHSKYESAVATAKSGDLVFFDPPYEPVSETSSFTSYTTDGFSFEDQKKLKEVFDSLVQKGCKVLLSNSDNQKILDLYSQYKIEKFEVNRNLNSKAEKRKKSAIEILVVG